MRPAFNFELKFRLTKLTREEWIRGPRTPLHLRGSPAIQKCPRRWGEPGSDSMKIFGNKSQYLSGKICYSFPGRDTCYLGLCLRNSNER